jgi:hypothetical protein
MITDLRALIANAAQVCALLGVAWMIATGFVILDFLVSQ